VAKFERTVFCGAACFVIQTPVISGKSVRLSSSDGRASCDAECFGLWSTGRYCGL